MDDMQNQMNAILGNPDMMQKIMSMAQSLSAESQPEQETRPQKPETPGFPISDIDLSMVQQLSGLAGRTNIDSNQRTLLKALTPYLTSERISKLEKAMRAAKMANLASAFLGKNGFQFSAGR